MSEALTDLTPLLSVAVPVTVNVPPTSTFTKELAAGVVITGTPGAVLPPGAGVSVLEEGSMMVTLALDGAPRLAPGDGPLSVMMKDSFDSTTAGFSFLTVTRTGMEVTPSGKVTSSLV